MANTLESPFDPSLYTRPPVISLLNGITLARALAVAAPKELPPQVHKAAQKLLSVAGSAEEAGADRQRSLGGGGDRGSADVDLLADRGWGALRGRLESYAQLPADRYKKAPRSQELLGTLFPEGLTFTKRTYSEQAAAMRLLLKRIEEEKLESDLNEICGPEFLANVRYIQPLYESMVQATLERATTSENLLLHIRGLAQAIVEYATKVAATVDSDDPSTLEPARRALRPLDIHREQTTRRNAQPAPDAHRPAPDMPEPSHP